MYFILLVPSPRPMVRNAIALLSNKNKLKWGTGLERNYKFDFVFFDKGKIKFINQKELKMADVEEIEEEYYESNEEYGDEDEGSFFESETSENSVSSRNTKMEQKAGTGITIDISSVEKLISQLNYSASALDSAINKVVTNRDISAILDELNKIRTMDISKFNAKVEEAITKFDMSKIEKKIDQKFDANMQKNFKAIENAANKYEKWGKVFEEPEALDTLDRVERIEKFTQNFKVRSIFFSCVFGFVSTAFLTYFTIQYLFEPQKSKVQTYANGDLSAFFSKIDNYQLAQNEKVIQLQIPISNKKIQIGENEKIKFIQIEK